VIRVHKIRLNPMPEQASYFQCAAGIARFVYNWGLEQWKKHKEAHPGEEYGVMAIKKALNAVKREQFPWMLEVTKCAAEGALINLGQAFKNYYDSKNGKRQGEKVGFPHFKSKKRSRQSFALNNDQFKLDGHSIQIPKLGWVNMAEELRFVGKIMGAVVSCRAGHWYVSMQVEVEKPVPVQFERESVGVDLGLKTLATLSSGQEYENQALLRRELNTLKRLSRQLSRRQEGSHRWYRTKNQLAKFHERIRNKRADVIHKMTTAIARTYRLIGVEDLHVKGMVRNRRLAFSIVDAGLGEVLRQLAYKADWFGGRSQQVGRFFASSKRCADCGHINHDLKLSDRTWVCASCRTTHPRDWNASKNIEAEALRLAYA
jgi:putative transposase